MDVTDVLRDRMREPAGLQQMVAVSVAVHVAAAIMLEQAPEGAKGRTPTKGPQTRFGSTVAETGTRGQGFGLSSGGGPGSGSTLDVADFCCPDYLMLMIET